METLLSEVRLNSILRGLLRVAGSTICVNWFDEITIELLVIIQSIVQMVAKDDLMVR